MVLAEPESRPGPLPGPHARPGPLPGPHARPGPRPGPAVQSHVVPKDPFTGPPKPYAFKYGVADVKTGSNFDHAQQQEASGVVRGEYRVNLPDGRVQIVSYEASAERGYVANVRYEGKAVYPDPPPKSKAHKRGKKVYKRKVKNPHMKFKEMKKRYPKHYKDVTFPVEKSPNLRFEE
jgi:hypothetical protein